MINIEINTKKRDISFELMRTVACIAVISIHVFSPYIMLFNKIKLSSWIFADTIMSFSRFPVQLFVMITGALLLKKDISVVQSLKKAVKFLIILILWSIAYLLICNIYFNKRTYSLQQIINMFLGNKTYYHLWYLYMLIGLYLVLPLITVLVKNLGYNLQKFYIIIFLSYSFIRMIPLLLSTIFNYKIDLYLTIPFMDWQIGCLVIGYFINNLEINKNKFRISVFLFVFINICSIVLTFLESSRIKYGSQGYFNKAFANNIIAAACMFTIIKYISKRISNISLYARLFNFIGSISLEIYLIHPLVITFYEKNIQIYISNFIHLLSLTYLFKFIFVLSVSIALAFLIKSITRKITPKSLSNSIIAA